MGGDFQEQLENGLAQLLCPRHPHLKTFLGLLGACIWIHVQQMTLSPNTLMVALGKPKAQLSKEMEVL